MRVCRPARGNPPGGRRQALVVVPITVADIRAAAARIHGRVLRTPVRRSEWLSGVSGGGVHLKLEVVQTTGSGKIRGAVKPALPGQQGPGAREPLHLVTASPGKPRPAPDHA